MERNHPRSTSRALRMRRVISHRAQVHWEIGAWAMLAVSVSAYAALGLILHQPFHVGPRALNAFDLRIYRGAAERIVHGVSLYASPIHDGLGFTYPPFAALIFAPLALGPMTADAVVVTAINLVVLVWLLRRTSTIALGPSSASPRTSVERRAAWSLAAGAAAAAIWIEPVSVTLGYGQINLVIAALVIGDLSRADEARTKGAGIGLAAALKLTPLLFIPYLLLSDRRRAAGAATAVFAASIAVARAVVPGDTAQYWGGRLFLDSSRVGGAADAADQSLRGMFARLQTGAHPAAGAQLAILAAAVLALVLAARASRRGDEAAGFSLIALGALLVSPISWTHHWTLAVPALLLLARRAHAQRSGRLTLAAVALLCLGCSYLPEYLGRVDPHGAISLLTSDSYVWVGCLVLLGSAVREALGARAHAAGRRRPAVRARAARHSSVASR